MAEGEWYYTINKSQTGPVSLQTVQAMASTGQLSRADLVWTDGMADWLPAGTVPAIVGKSAKAPPRPAPVKKAQQLNYGGGPQMGAYGGVSHADEAKSALKYAIIAIFCFGFILGPIAISKANKAKAAMASSGNFDGQGMATAATIIGWIAAVLAVLATTGRIYLLINGSR